VVYAIPRSAWSLALVLLLAAPLPAQGPAGIVKELSAPGFRHRASVYQVLAVDGGKRLLTASGEGVVLWDTTTGKRLKTLVDGDVRQFALGDNLLVVRDSSGMEARNLAKGEVLWKTFAPPSGVSLPRDGRLALSADSQHLAISRGVGCWIELQKAASGKTAQSFNGHEKPITDLVFHPDGKSLFSASKDGTLRQWNLVTGKDLCRQTEPPGRSIFALAFSEDGKNLAVVTADHDASPEKAVSHVCVLDTSTWQERFRAVLPATWPNRVALSPNTRYVAAAFHWARPEDGHVRLWDTWTARAIRLDPGNSSRVNDVHFLPDGKTLASVGDDHAVHLWNVADGSELPVSRGPAGQVVAMALAPAGDVLASAHSVGTIHLWDAIQGKPLHALRQPGGLLHSLAFSPSGDLLLSVADTYPPSGDGRLACLWDVGSGACLHTLEGVCRGAVFTPDGKSVAAGDLEHNVRLWDVATGKESKRWTGHSGRVRAVAFTADGRLLAAADSDGKLYLRNTATGQLLLTVPAGGPHVETLWFSPNGALLFAYEAQSGAVEVYETLTGQRLHALATDRVFLQAPQFAHGGRTLVVAHMPGWWRAFDLATGRAIGKDPLYAESFNAVAAVPNGNLLAAGYMDGRVLLWQPVPLPPLPPLPAPGRRQMPELWQALAGSDARRAHEARWLLAEDARQTLDLLRRELRPVAPVDAKQVAAWLALLDSLSYKERVRAMQALEQAGDVVELSLRQALAHKPSLELGKRLETVLAHLAASPTGETLRTLRAITLLEGIGTDEAQALLRVLADGAPGARVTEAARAALQRGGKLP
jgi:WD40 repeat protein